MRTYRDLPALVWILAAGTLVNRAGAMLLPFLTIYLSVEKGHGVPFATGTMSAYGAGALAAALLGGHLADSLGRKRVILLSMIGGALFLLVWGFLEDPVAIVAFAVVTGAFMEMYRPASYALVADSVPAAQRPHAFGLMHMAVNLGFTIAPVAGGLLAERSFLLLFVGDAATALACAGILARFVVEPRPAAGSAAGANDLHAARGFRAIAEDRAFLLFCFASLLMAAMWAQSSATLPLFLTGAGYSPSEIGRLVAINGLLIVLFQLPATALVSRIDRRVTLGGSAVLVGVGFALHAAGTTVPAVLLAITVWTLGEIATAPIAGSVVADLAPDGMRARYLGVFTFSYTLSVMLGPLLGGAVLTRWGAQTLWLGCLGIGVVCAALFVRVFSWAPRAAGRTEGQAPAEAPVA